MPHALSRPAADAAAAWSLLAVLVLVLLLLPAGARAATLTPTTTADQYDLVADAECSLREAVESANLNADFGGCVAAGAYGDDVIELAAGTYSLTLGPTESPVGIDNSVGDLDVEPGDVERLDFLGEGAAVTTIERASAEEFRVLDVIFPSRVRLADLTVRNGLVADDFGGGIYSEGFELTLERVVVRDNGVVGGGFAVGGGIFVESEVLSLVDSEVVDNRVDPGEAFFPFSVAGGGIFAFVGQEPLACECGLLAEAAVPPTASSLNIEGSTISGNQAVGNPGGDVALGGGAFLVDFSQLSNPALVGPQRIVNSTFSGNSADGGGGLVIDVVPLFDGERLLRLSGLTDEVGWRERFARERPERRSRSERAQQVEGGER